MSRPSRRSIMPRRSWRQPRQMLRLPETRRLFCPLGRCRRRDRGDTRRARAGGRCRANRYPTCAHRSARGYCKSAGGNPASSARRRAARLSMVITASRFPALLRQLSDAADPVSRTYEARYVLEGAAGDAPLGATVTIRFLTTAWRRSSQFPLARSPTRAPLQGLAYRPEHVDRHVPSCDACRGSEGGGADQTRPRGWRPGGGARRSSAARG